mgnify:CR=1 FL=1
MDDSHAIPLIEYRWIDPLNVIYYTFRKEQRHTFLLDFEGVSITISTWTAQKQINSNQILFQKHIELSNIRILGVFNLLLSEILLAIIDFILQPI